MYFALKSLLQEAQNNLKIFKVKVASILWLLGGSSGCLNWAGWSPGAMVPNRALWPADKGICTGAASVWSLGSFFQALFHERVPSWDSWGV